VRRRIELRCRTVLRTGNPSLVELDARVPPDSAAIDGLPFLDSLPEESPERGAETALAQRSVSGVRRVGTVGGVEIR
jgi:hypothetical protein